MGTGIELGTIDAAEGVLRDLYVDLRRRVRQWSELTKQTPQARMGYIGQHLVSAVTGFQGGRSGARGKDLVLPGGRHAEIKTCSRVDQLGSCANCSERVSSIEAECGACGSTNLTRRDDSKWLIGVRSEQELAELFNSEHFYLVLFDFVDFTEEVDINARVWRVDPRSTAFAYCMIDYYFNIGTRSASGAPFNLWPFKLKFDLLRPELIFHAIVTEDDAISVQVMEGQVGKPQIAPLPPLTKYSRSGRDELTVDRLRAVAIHLGAPTELGTKASILTHLEADRLRRSISDETLVDVLCDALYGKRIMEHFDALPVGISPPSFVSD